MDKELTEQTDKLLEQLGGEFCDNPDDPDTVIWGYGNPGRVAIVSKSDIRKLYGLCVAMNDATKEFLREGSILVTMKIHDVTTTAGFNRFQNAKTGPQR